MKITDLTIGDWVRLRDKTKTKAQVLEIFPKGIIAYDFGIRYGAPLEWSEIEPIPLTPEILEKNGFEKLGYDGWEYKLKKVNKLMYSVLWRCDYPNALRISSYSPVYGDFNSFHIDNVHELQHALRLCGIDKKIEL